MKRPSKTATVALIAGLVAGTALAYSNRPDTPTPAVELTLPEVDLTYYRIEPTSGELEKLIYGYEYIDGQWVKSEGWHELPSDQ